MSRLMTMRKTTVFAVEFALLQILELFLEKNINPRRVATNAGKNVTARNACMANNDKKMWEGGA